MNNGRVDGKGEARDKDRVINMSGAVFVLDDEGVKLVAKLRSMWIPRSYSKRNSIVVSFQGRYVLGRYTI